MIAITKYTIMYSLKKQLLGSIPHRRRKIGVERKFMRQALLDL